jgi:hypothetical protein
VLKAYLGDAHMSKKIGGYPGSTSAIEIARGCTNVTSQKLLAERRAAGGQL